MLPPFIIEQIRRREEAQRRKTDAKQPRLELPIEGHEIEGHEPARESEGADDERQRGVLIVDI